MHEKIRITRFFDRLYKFIFQRYDHFYERIKMGHFFFRLYRWSKLILFFRYYDILLLRTLIMPFKVKHNYTTKRQFCQSVRPACYKSKENIRLFLKEKPPKRVV